MNSGAINPPKTREELTEYEQGWADMMVDIWHEQMAALHTIDTGRLYGSIRSHVTTGSSDRLEHQFVQYGMYVNEGTGREFNDKIGQRGVTGEGQLMILDSGYREEHGLNKPRKRGPAWGGGYTSGHPRQAKPWFDKKYLYSIYRLREVLQAAYPEQYQNMTLQALDNVMAPIADNYNMTTSAADRVF